MAASFSSLRFASSKKPSVTSREMPLQEVESRKNKPLLRARRLFCPPTFDFRLSTFDFRLSTFDFRLSTFDLRPSTFDLRPSTFDLRPSTFDLRPSTFDFHSHLTPLATSGRARRSSPTDLRLSDLRRPSSQFQHFIRSAWRPWRLSGSNPENWKTWKQVKGTLNINDPDAWNQWLKRRFLGLIVAGAGGHELRRPLTT
jgi:hypothetical protein